MMRRRRPEVTGHGVSRGLKPENSLTAIAADLKPGVDCLITNYPDRAVALFEEYT